MNKKDFKQQLKRIKYKFGYLSDDFLIGLAEEYYKNKEIANIPIDKFEKVIDTIMNKDYKYMLTIYQLLNLYHDMYSVGGYNDNCEACNGCGYIPLIQIITEKEVVAPCICNKSFHKNYQDFINSGKYKLTHKPTLNDISEHLEIIKNKNYPLHKIIKEIHDKHFDHLPF